MSSCNGKRLLILSGPMGNGHVRAAESLAACARDDYPGLSVEHINCAALMNPAMRAIFTHGYTAVLRHCPHLWRSIYDKTNAPPGTSGWDRFFHWFARRASGRMARYIERCGADYILCTHFLPAGVLDELKARDAVRVRAAVVVTDFDTHWAYVLPHLDHVFAPVEKGAFKLRFNGVPAERISLTGIPVMPGFTRAHPVREIREELGIPSGARAVMVAAGGDGLGPIDTIARFVLEQTDDHVIVLCGHNAGMLAAVREIAARHPGRCTPVPFTDDVDRYMAASDVVVTKPGGITVSESLAMRKMTIVMDPVPGHEERNVDHLLECSLAVKASDLPDLLYKLDVLRDNAAERERLQTAADREGTRNAARHILSVILAGGAARAGDGSH